MKGTILSLLILIISTLCQASEQAALPEEPWRAISFMEKRAPDIRWEGDISIKLFGSYTQKDSLMIENSINILNELCETIQLRISAHDRGKLEVHFLDSINRQDYENIVYLGPDQKSGWQFKYNPQKIITHFNQAINLELIPKEDQQNFLTNTLAWALYPKQLSIDYLFKNGRKVYKRPNSIFNIVSSTQVSNKWIKYEPPFNSELSQFDRQLIKTVYATNFSKLLPIAKKQFIQFPDWLRNNSRKIMIFPLVLALFLFTGLLIIFYKKLGMKIQNKLLLFNIIGTLSLLGTGILMSFGYVIAEKLKDSYFSFFNVIDFVGGLLILLILGLPAINGIRLVERAIHRKTQHKYFKVLLLFLSTSLIPSVTLFSIAYFTFKDDIDKDGIKAFLIVFLVIIGIASIRALISFFFLKEKEIKIETEVKLAHLRELKTKAELNALHSKINPHFLYNALNSIAGLAKIDSEKTEHMTLSLSKLFRYSINKGQSDWSTLAEEMEMVKIYLEIEKVRFDDRLEFTIELPDLLKSAKVPRFIIQPLVENAIKHGISKSITKGFVKISMRKEVKWMEIKVSDNGPDFPKELAPGFGLQSIYDKLEILYPNRFELYFVNSPDKHILIRLS